MKLRTSRPAPVSRIMDSATWAITSRLRGRMRPAERAWSEGSPFSTEATSGREARKAGNKPKARTVTSETASVRANTRASTRNSKCV